MNGITREEAQQKRKWDIPKGTKIIRFTDENWMCFFTKGKETTWRKTKRKDGVYHRVKGSLYNPKDTGETLQLTYEKSKQFCDLNAEDAIRDGFDTLAQFRAELTRLQGKPIDPTTIFHCHRAALLVKIQRLEADFESHK